MNRKKEIIAGFLTIISTVFITAVYCGTSWIITCGITKLITMCFGWTFKWHVATGVWVVLSLVIIDLELHASKK